MKYEGEVLSVEQVVGSATVKLTNVYRCRQAGWDGSTSVVEITMPLSAANRAFRVGRKVVVTVEAK